MTFENLHADIECDCLVGAEVDTESHFGRFYNGNNGLQAKHFNSKWERNQRPETNTCEAKCGYKGISLNKMNEDNRERVLTIFRQVFDLARNYRPHVCVLQLDENSGMVKPTPDLVHENPFHYDFFKSDEFDFTKLVQVETISLAENV